MVAETFGSEGKMAQVTRKIRIFFSTHHNLSAWNRLIRAWFRAVSRIREKEKKNEKEEKKKGLVIEQDWHKS